MCISVVVVTIGLIDHLLQQYRYYTLRQQATESANRFVSCFREYDFVNNAYVIKKDIHAMTRLTDYKKNK